MFNASWKKVEARVRNAEKETNRAGFVHEDQRMKFGPKGMFSVEGAPYRLALDYTVDGRVYPISFSMICDTVPSTIILAYNTDHPEEWDWPEDRITIGGDVA